MYKKFDVNQTNILDAEKRLEEAKRELERAKEKRDEVQKVVEEKEDKVDEILIEIKSEQSHFMPYKEFSKDLQDSVDRLTKEWNETKENKPDFLIAVEIDGGYQYYPAFNGVEKAEDYGAIWHWRRSQYTSSLRKDDPNYSSFKMVLEDQRIIVDIKLYAKEGYWENEIKINEMVALVYVFFYRDLKDFYNAAVETKKYFEKIHLEKIEKERAKMIQLLYSLYFKHS